MKKFRNRTRYAVATAALAALSTALSASTFTWSGGDTGHGYFSAGDNWAGGVAPTTNGNADLIFGATNITNSAPFAESPYSINSINFSSGAYAFTGNANIEASQLTIGSGGLIDLASAQETISNAVALNANQTWNVSGGNFNQTGAVNLGTSSLTAYVPSGSLSFNAAVTATPSSTATFNKTGAGLLNFSAVANSTVGLVNFAQGTTNLSGGMVLTTLASGSSFLGNSSGTATLNITGTGSYLNASTCSFFFGNGSGQSGTMNVTNSGEFIAGAIFVPGAGTGTLNVTSGGEVETPALYLGNSGTTGSGATVLVSGSGSFIDATQLTLGQANNGSLTISNNASVAITNVTTFGGATFPINISSGTFSTGALNSITSSSGQILMNASPTATGITIQGGSGTTGEYFGTITGTGIIYKSGASIQAFGSGQTVNGLTVNGGQLNVSGGTFKLTNVTGPLIVNGSGTLTVNNSATLDASANTGNNYIDGSGTGATVNVSGSGSVLKAGSYLYVGFNNNDTGNLNVTSSGNVSVASLDVPNNGKGIVTVSSNGLISANQFSLGNGQANLVTLTGGGNLNVSGLSYFFDSTSKVNVSGGAFTTAGLTSSGLPATGYIFLSADPTGGTALTINGTSGTNTYSGNILGPTPSNTAGSILKTGASTQILSGTVYYNGGLTENGGTLALTGGTAGNTAAYVAVQSGNLNISTGSMDVYGAVPINISGGTLTVNSGAIFYANAAQNIQIDGTATPTLTVSGNGSVFNASSLSVYVAQTTGHNGTLNVNNGAVFDSGPLFVPGVGGNGTLNVSSGGVVNCGPLYLDNASQTGSCIAILSGTGSQINATSLTLSSSNNPGSLTIANGAVFNVPGALTFTTSAFPINVSAGSLTVGGLSSQGTGSSGAINLLADSAIGAALTLNASSGTYGYSGSFTGVGTLLKTGGSTQIYTGTGTLGTLQLKAGGFNVTSGSLTLTNSSGGVQVNGGNLLVNSGATLNANATTTWNYIDNATMTVTGTGTKFLAGSEFDVSEFGNLSTLTVSSSAQMSAGALYVPYSGVSTMTVTSSAQVSTGTLTFSQSTLIPSTLTVSAGGSLIVTGTSFFEDAISQMNISSGAVTTGALSSVSGNGRIGLTDPSGGPALTINAASGANSFSGNLSGTGTLLKTGGSTQVLAGGASSIGALSVQAGALNVSGGTLWLTQVAGFPIDASGGTLTLNSAAIVNAPNASIHVGGAGPANLTVTGLGTQLNTPVGLTVQGGGLATLSATQKAAITSGNLYMFGSSALVINSGASLSSAYDGVGELAGATTSVTVDGQGSTWADTVMHIGGYASTGGNATVTITNLAAVTTRIDTSFESSSATMNVSGGTLTTGGLNSLNVGNGTLLLTDPALAAALTLNDANPTDVYTYSGSISGTGSLNKYGAFTQVLSGTNTFTGAVAVNGGILTMTSESATFYQVTNGTLNLTNPFTPVRNAPMIVENGGVLTGPADYQDTPVTLMPGGTFLPGSYNGSFAGISGASSLVQPANGSDSTFAILVLNAPTTFNVSTGNYLQFYDNISSNNNAITKTGGGTVLMNTFQTKSLTISAGQWQVTSLSSMGPLILGGLTLSSGAQLDIDQSPVIIGNSASLAVINAEVQAGFNNGAWNGSGIFSHDAANSLHLTAVGVIQNNQGGTPLFSSSNLFDGIAPGVNDVLLKYTYYGDTNLDGKVDGSDYSRIDSGYLTGTTGWFNGDFNYDGVINGSDYTLIDNAFNRQGAQLTGQLAALTAQVASSAVPEPASMLILIPAFTTLLGRRKPKRLT